MRSVFLISCLLTSTLWSNSPISHNQPFLNYGHNLSQSIWQSNTLDPNGLLPYPIYRIDHTWLEPLLSDLKDSPQNGTNLAWESSFSISPYDGEINSGLKFRLFPFMEFGLDYSNRFYFGSQVYVENLDNNQFDSDEMDEKWNSEYIQNHLWQDDEFINIQSFVYKVKFIVVPALKNYGLEIEFNHSMIDVNSSVQGRLYDFGSRLPVLPRDDIGELLIRQLFIKSKSHYYTLELLYQATHFKEDFVSNPNFFPDETNKGSLTQLSTLVGGTWALGENKNFGANLIHSLNSQDDGIDADQFSIHLNLEYILCLSTEN